MGVLDFWNIAVFILIFGLTMLWTLAMHQHPKQPSSSVTKLEFENMGQLTLEHCNTCSRFSLSLTCFVHKRIIYFNQCGVFLKSVLTLITLGGDKPVLGNRNLSWLELWIISIILYNCSFLRCSAQMLSGVML